MKRDLESLYHWISYKEGLGLDKASSSHKWKKSIDICAIVNAVGRMEREKIFCEDGVLGCFFNLHGCT